VCSSRISYLRKSKYSRILLDSRVIGNPRMILSLDGHSRVCKSGNQGWQGTYNPGIYVNPVGKSSVNTGLGYIYIICLDLYSKCCFIQR